MRPSVSYCHLWTDKNGVSHQEQCELANFELKGVGGADQGCTKSVDGRKGHRFGTIDEPAVLMTVQLHVDPRHEPCHMR